MGCCATAARSGREARGNRAAGGGGKPPGGAWRGPAQCGSADQVDAGRSLSGSRPPTGSAVERLKGLASEACAWNGGGTGRGGLKVLASA